MNADATHAAGHRFALTIASGSRSQQRQQHTPDVDVVPTGSVQNLRWCLYGEFLLTNISAIITIRWETFWWFWDLLKSTNVGWAWGKSSGFTTKHCNGTPPTTTPLVDLIWLFHVSFLDLRYLNLIGGAPTLPCSRVSGLLVEARQSLQAFILFYHVNGSSILNMLFHSWTMQRPEVVSNSSF